MIKEVTVQEQICDVPECGVRRSRICIECGKMFCYDHMKEHGVEYRANPYIIGYPDGHYCKGCDTDLTFDGNDALHNAYLAVQRATEEYAKASAKFTADCNLLQSQIVILIQLKEHGKR